MAYILQQCIRVIREESIKINDLKSQNVFVLYVSNQLNRIFVLGIPYLRNRYITTPTTQLEKIDFIIFEKH